MLPQRELSTATVSPVSGVSGGARDAERHYRTLFDRAPLAYLVTDTAGVIRQANRAAAVLLKRPAELLAKQSLDAFVPLDRRRAFRDRLEWLPLLDRAHDWHVSLVPHGAAPVDVAAHVEVTDGTRAGESVVCWLLRPISCAAVSRPRRAASTAPAPASASWRSGRWSSVGRPRDARRAPRTG